MCQKLKYFIRVSKFQEVPKVRFESPRNGSVVIGRPGGAHKKTAKILASMEDLDDDTYEDGMLVHSCIIKTSQYSLYTCTEQTYMLHYGHPFQLL